MKRIHLLTAGFLSVLSIPVLGQPITAPLIPGRWDTTGADIVVENYEGRESILVRSGLIFLKDVDLLDGTIEADINFAGQRSFPGFAFRLQDRRNFENFYMRPHQSGNPDATQYTPVFNGQAGWQLYHGEGYSQAISFKFNNWHHIKIDIHGLQAEIYIDDMQKPLLKVKELKRDWKAGKIGLISDGVPVHFAGIRYTIKTGSEPTALPVPANGTGGLITRWQLSQVVNNTFFENKYQLTSDMKKQLTWKERATEPSGIINLSKFTRPADTGNTMVAKLVIESASAQVKAISFGFSDFVLVYLNDKVLYSGSDNFRSRDYRFLGTIGFFDKLFLPLKKGSNELWFVLSENFGGWGIEAKLENIDKISLE